MPFFLSFFLCYLLLFAPLWLCERFLRSNLRFAGGRAFELLGDQKKFAAAVE